MGCGARAAPGRVNPYYIRVYYSLIFKQKKIARITSFW